MTAPADVWFAVETGGEVAAFDDGSPLLWPTEKEARECGDFELGASRVVRFRLVRVDDDQPQRDPGRDEVGELRECVRELVTLTQHLANEMTTAEVGDALWVFRQLGELRDRLTAQSGPAGEVGDGS